MTCNQGLILIYTHTHTPGNVGAAGLGSRAPSVIFTSETHVINANSRADFCYHVSIPGLGCNLAAQFEDNMIMKISKAAN